MTSTGDGITPQSGTSSTSWTPPAKLTRQQLLDKMAIVDGIILRGWNGGSPGSFIVVRNLNHGWESIGGFNLTNKTWYSDAQLLDWTTTYSLTMSFIKRDETY